MTAKDRHRIRIIEYISDWDNAFPSRTEMSEICEVTPDTLRKHFTVDEFTEIEDAGLELRKKKSARQRGEVYEAILSSAKDGVVPAQKEFLDRTEGKIADKIKHGIDAATLTLIFSKLPVEYAEELKKALIE